MTGLRSKEKDAKIGRGAPGVAALASAGVLACFALVLVGASLPGAHAQRSHGVDLKVRSLVAPAVVSGADFELVVTVANKGDRTARRSKVRAFLSQDKGRDRGDVRLLAAKSIPPLAPGARARETVTAEDSTEHGHRSLVPNRLRSRSARRQQPKRLPTIVAPYHRLELSGRFEYRAYRFAEGVHRQHHRLNAGRCDRRTARSTDAWTVNARAVTIRNSEIHCGDW